MTESDEKLLAAIDQMAEQAPGVGLCSTPFKMLHDEVRTILLEKTYLAAYREPKAVKPYKGWHGQCPSCGVVFLDDSTPYCGACGQRITFPKE